MDPGPGGFLSALFPEPGLRPRRKMKQVRGKGVKTDIACPACGKPMTIRIGKNGPFLACSAYPECKQTQNFVRDEKGNIQPVAAEAPPAADSGKTCPQCGKPMVVRQGRFGLSWPVPDTRSAKRPSRFSEEGKEPEASPKVVSDQDCPQCGGPMVVKKNRFGGTFLACEKYPKCKGRFAGDDRIPLPESGLHRHAGFPGGPEKRD